MIADTDLEVVLFGNCSPWIKLKAMTVARLEEEVT